VTAAMRVILVVASAGMTLALAAVAIHTVCRGWLRRRALRRSIAALQVEFAAPPSSPGAVGGRVDAAFRPPASPAATIEEVQP
jgi:hypothetical protein